MQGIFTLKSLLLELMHGFTRKKRKWEAFEKAGEKERLNLEAAQSLNKRLFRLHACRASRCLYSYQAQVMPYQLQSLKYEITLHDREHLMLK